MQLIKMEAVMVDGDANQQCCLMICSTDKYWSSINVALCNKQMIHEYSELMTRIVVNHSSQCFRLFVHYEIFGSKLSHKHSYWFLISAYTDHMVVQVHSNSWAPHRDDPGIISIVLLFADKSNSKTAHDDRTNCKKWHKDVLSMAMGQY